MEINLFSKENETEKIKLMNTVLIVVYVILEFRRVLFRSKDYIKISRKHSIYVIYYT